MADSDRMKLSTCPICGYTDSATDPEALASEIALHMKSAHNLDAAGMMDPGTIKATGVEVGEDGVNTAGSFIPPAPATVANLGTAPSAAMAPPNLGYVPSSGAPGDPQTAARDPYDDDRRDDRRQ